MTAADLLSLTAHQLFALFFVLKDPTKPEPDRVAELARHNRDVRAKRGLPPAVPSWLWKG